MAHTLSENRPVALWLFVCCALVFSMVVLGGATRLTGSGLSMVVWEPIMGIVPPLTQSEWMSTFEMYKQFPEYQKKNLGMSLEEFKIIFWFEYSHRILGRLIGVAFLIPMVVFLLLRRVERPLVPRLVFMFVLGGLQGLLGWYMVKSGLVNNPHVSQYRLTAHLAAAIVIYAYMLWVALDLWFARTDQASPTIVHPRRRFAVFVTGFIFLTILSGGFVAGLKAGFSYNTFPKMGETWIAPGIMVLEPAWRNLFENAATVQFDHRVLAITALVVVIAFWVRALPHADTARTRLGLHLLLLAVVVQVGLGITTLLLHVPIVLASAHQAGAVVLLTAALFVTHALYRAHAPATTPQTHITDPVRSNV